MTADFLRTIPKIQLHCHLEGTLRAATFLELTQRDGISTRYRPGGGELAVRPESEATVYDFADFNEFLLTFAAVSRALRLPSDYARLAREYAEDAIAQNVAHAELFVSPSVWRFFHPDLDLRACLGAIDTALRETAREKDVTFSLIVDLTRNFGTESAMETARLAVACRAHGVVGIGLGGDEARFPAPAFKDAFAYARGNGLHAVAHAGEAAGAQSVRDAVEILGAERIGHGVRALEDPAVIAMLAERGIPLELCPTSNFLTGVVARGDAHPIFALDALGVLVTVDADDPAIFQTTLTGEYAYVAETAGVETLVRFVGNAVEASFAPEARKRELRERLARAGVEMPPLRRT